MINDLNPVRHDQFEIIFGQNVFDFLMPKQVDISLKYIFENMDKIFEEFNIKAPKIDLKKILDQYGFSSLLKSKGSFKIARNLTSLDTKNFRTPALKKIPSIKLDPLKTGQMDKIIAN